MNTQEAILFLSNKGIKVHAKDDKYTVYWNDGSIWQSWLGRELGYEQMHSGREIVKLARQMRDSGSIPSLGKNVKSFSNSKDRARTRDLVSIGDFDSIPLNKRTAESDRWDWD
jgi:hypothetical protein